MSNYPATKGLQNILDILDREGLLLKVVDSLEENFSKLKSLNAFRRTSLDPHFSMRDLIERLANCAYVERSFSRKFGDAAIVHSVHAGKYRIRVQKNMRSVDYPEYIDTVLHELSHVVDFIFRGGSNHDKVWEEIAKMVGAKPIANKRASDAMQKMMNKYEWVCTNSSCGFAYQFNRKKKMCIDRYQCPKCNSDLKVPNGMPLGYNERSMDSPIGIGA